MNKNKVGRKPILKGPAEKSTVKIPKSLTDWIRNTRPGVPIGTALREYIYIGAETQGWENDQGNQ